MKIRHPALLAGGGFAASLVIRGLVGSLRYRVRYLDPEVNPHRPGGQPNRFLYAFWHEAMLLPAYLYGKLPLKVLISQHADGELITQTCRHLGFGFVRGSTTRGGVQALREILALKGKYHIAVTPDGPRGPRRQVQQGLTFLASRTGMPIVPVGFAVRTCRRMNSWDRFMLPCPFSPAVGVFGRPIRLPADLGRAGLEESRVVVEQAMLETTRLAEEWVDREEW